jgi:hypothetical protein
MIRPEPRSSIPGNTMRVTRNVPRKWMAIISSHMATSISATGDRVTMPALLTRTSMYPKAASTWATICRTASSSATFASTATARRPSASICAATSRASPKLR